MSELTGFRTRQFLLQRLRASGRIERARRVTYQAGMARIGSRIRRRNRG